jgi:hypothetical protein
MIRASIHLLLHFIVPAAVAEGIREKVGQSWYKIWFTLISANLIDLDHLLADTVYDPNRCSIAFHPLHSYVAIVLYVTLLVPERTRVIGLGLIIHILLDALDCVLM